MPGRLPSPVGPASLKGRASMVGSPCVIFARLSDFTRTGNQSLRMVLPVRQGLRRYRSVAGTSENLLLSMRGLAARDNRNALTVGRAEVLHPRTAVGASS